MQLDMSRNAVYFFEASELFIGTLSEAFEFLTDRP
jgi:hypothetical protein